MAMKNMRSRWWLAISSVSALLFLLLVLVSPPGQEWWYIQRLKRGRYETQCVLARKLGRMKCRRAVPHLIALLDRPGHSRATVSCSVARALGEIGDQRAVPHLIALLDRPGHSRARVSCCAAIALGEIGDQRAVDPLIQLIQKPANRLANGYRFREDAAYALGKLGDHRATDALRGMLSDTAYGVGESAGSALVALGLDREEVRNARLKAVLSVLQGSEEPRAREAAVGILSRTESPAVIPTLYGALSDESEDVRARSHRSLAAMGESEDNVVNVRRRATLTFLSHADALVRREATRGLLRIGRAEDVTILIDALRDSDKEVRWWAARALGRIANPAAIPALRAAKADRYWRVRDCAAISLADLGDKSVIPDLKKLYEKYPTVNKWLTDRLRKLGVTEDGIAEARADAKNRQR